jgi:hypothetical protein
MNLDTERRAPLGVLRSGAASVVFRPPRRFESRRHPSMREGGVQCP